MGCSGFDPTLDNYYRSEVLTSIADNFPSPPSSTDLFLSAPIQFEDYVLADTEGNDEYILPDIAVTIIFAYLPIKDVFRFGFKLSRTWSDLWKKAPLFFHDVQMLPDIVKGDIEKASLFRKNIVSDITRVLDLHPGPVACMRLEFTAWSEENLLRWIEMLGAKGVYELELFGPWPLSDLHMLPHNIIHFNQLRILALCFFKIPVLRPDEMFSLPLLRALTIAECKFRSEDITVLLLSCPNLHSLSFGHIKEGGITVSSRSLIMLRLWNCSLNHILIMNCPKLMSLIQAIEHKCVQQTAISVKGSPGIDEIYHLYLDQQILQINGIQIKVGMENHPHYHALTVLSLRVKFHDNDALAIVRELLMSFPNLLELTITRMDPDEPCTTLFVKWKDLIPGIKSVEEKLQMFRLENSGLADTEIELAESILLYAGALNEFVIMPSTYASEASRRKLGDVMLQTIPASRFISDFHLNISV